MSTGIRYAKSGDVSLAYAVTGDGPADLVIVPGFVSHLEYALEEPSFARMLKRLSSFARVISFDKRGTGLSDRGVGLATIDEYMQDVRCVMEAAGVERASIMGVSEGGSTALLFAATYPQLTDRLVVYGSYARLAEAPDYPIGFPVDQIEGVRDWISDRWGSGVSLGAWAPSHADDPSFREWWSQFQRLAASPGDVRAIVGAYPTIDVREALGAISAPTLVLHRVGDAMVPIDMGRYIAERIRGAKLVELPGPDHFPWAGDVDGLVDEIEEFLTGERHAAEPDRKLATILFTDIVASTERAGELGDRAWKDLLERHDAMVRRTLARFGGREVHTTGDGFLATFEGPTSAIRCGEAIRGGASALGIDVRVGIHTGEVELRGDDIAGIAVHIANRVASVAEPGEVWVSQTVPGVVVGSGVIFRDRGAHPLKGIEGDWQLYSVGAA